jgi:pyruvate/2-oxoglutarate dehydrogenase complex dihydrolipoamide acyltransferase (E2) component
MRRTIAQRMQASWQQIPHILFTLDIDMTAAARCASSTTLDLEVGGWSR